MGLRTELLISHSISILVRGGNFTRARHAEHASELFSCQIHVSGRRRTFEGFSQAFCWQALHRRDEEFAGHRHAV